MDHDGACDCFGCKARSIQFSPSCTPTRRNSLPPRGSQHNSWENGVKTDERGMPLLDERMNPISVKTYASERGHLDERRRELATSPDPFKE